MCNHYRNIPGAEKLLQSWREYISWSIDAPPPIDNSMLEEDVWPRRVATVVRHSAEAGGAFIDHMAWGVPLSVSGKRPGTKISKYITNVRNLDSPFWRNMLAKPEQRCLVPFNSFAEPVIGQGRAEHWFHVRERSVSAFAGVWRWAAEIGPVAKPSTPQDLFANLEDAAQSPADDRHPQKVFAFLTCAPNPLVAPLHPKAMPVILAEADYEAWLSADWAEAAQLVVPFPSQMMSVE